MHKLDYNVRRKGRLFSFCFEKIRQIFEIKKNLNKIFTVLIHLRLSYFHVLKTNIDSSKITLTEVGLKQIRNIFLFRY